MGADRWIPRLATVQEAGEVARLLHDFNSEFGTPTPGADVLATRLAVLLAGPETIAILAGAPAVAVALVTLRPNVWYAGPVALLDELYVVPDLRGHGIGSGIIDQLMATARARGVDLIEINVDEGDVDAQRFYERHGFSATEPGSTERALYYAQELHDLTRPPRVPMSSRPSAGQNDGSQERRSSKETHVSALTPAAELAATNPIRHPNESDEYRRARQALLVEEIELRRHAEHVAALRRDLPPGGEVTGDYHFVAEDGTDVTLSDLFGDHDTLIVYSYMFGPQREAPCPMCTSLMGGLDHKIADIRQRVAVAFTARSPIERLVEAKSSRGWTDLPVYSDGQGDYTRDYVSPDDADMPAYNVFTRRDGVIRHFWSDEITGDMADPGQDPRGAVEMDPLWLLLDTSPEGRGADWHPQLTY